MPPARILTAILTFFRLIVDMHRRPPIDANIIQFLPLLTFERSYYVNGPVMPFQINREQNINQLNGSEDFC